jgi:hypothetical protein
MSQPGKPLRVMLTWQNKLRNPWQEKHHNYEGRLDFMKHVKYYCWTMMSMQLIWKRWWDGGLDSEKWLNAMRSEIESMGNNQVWNLVNAPDGVKSIEWESNYKKKIDMDGNIHIYKARLVAKHFWKVQGVDYKETYSAVAMLKSVQIILAIATYSSLRYGQWMSRLRFSI